MNDKVKKLDLKKPGVINALMRFPLIGSKGTLPESAFLKRRKKIRGLKKGGSVKK